ncbi:MAG: PP0621 family protein [Nitrosomonadaceae bacterium]|nr:PP0621 family protein [Betaproteobacteria bacterium]
MGRLLFFALIAVLIFWLLTRWARKKETQDKKTPSIKGEDMVCCEYCGIHVPRSESISIHDKSFCSEEHQRLYSE